MIIAFTVLYRKPESALRKPARTNYLVNDADSRARCWCVHDRDRIQQTVSSS